MKQNLVKLYEELDSLYKFNSALGKERNESDDLVRAGVISYVMKRMCELFPDDILPF